MATKIYDGTTKNCYFSSNEKYEWFRVKFDEDGLANFWINSSGLDSDLDLYVYEEEDRDSKRLGKSTEVPGEGEPDDIIWEVPVRRDTYYYIYVKKYGSDSCSYLLKAKNHPQDIDNDYELIIDDIKLTDEEPFSVNEQTVFRVKVKNIGESESPEYIVYVYDEDGNELADDDEYELSSGSTNYGNMRVTMNRSGNHRLKFVIKVDGDIVDTAYRTYEWKSDIGEQYVDVAMKELGYAEGANNFTKYGTWYGLQDEWCHMYASWCANEAGIMDSLVPNTCSTPDGSNWYKNKDKFEYCTGNYNPKAGDLVYFYSKAKGRIGHVGIVVAYVESTETLYTIEGNSGDKVSLRYYPNMRSNKYVNGFGIVGGNSSGTIRPGATEGTNLPIT